MFIAIEGAIGAGKTTLAELLSERLASAKLVLEQFEENPFLVSFYEDRPAHAFQTQIFFLLSRFRQQKQVLQTDLFFENIVSDYLFAKDRIFATINLSEDELALYDDVEQALIRSVPIPDVVIYLQAGVPELLEGVRRRGRSFEQNLSPDYLSQVVEAYNEYFFHYRDSRLIVVNAQDVDFFTHPEQIERLLAAIFREPHPPVEYLSVPPPTPIFSS